MNEDDSGPAALRQLREEIAELREGQSADFGRLQSELLELKEQVSLMALRVPPPMPTKVPMDPPKPVVAPAPVSEPQVQPGARAQSVGEVVYGFAPPPESAVEEPKAVPAPVPVSEESVEAPQPAPVPAEKGSIELNFGRVWLVRLGIALLVTGLVLLGNYAYRNWIRDLPAIARLGFLLAGAIGISAAGWWFTLKEGMKRFGEVVLAGGMAFFYWCVYAGHHVERLQVVSSPVVAALLLLGAAGAIVWVSLKREAKATAVMGLLLASYSTVLQPLGWMSGISNMILAGAGVMLMRKPGWSAPGVASMAGTYLSFLLWHLAGASGGGSGAAGLLFLPAVWVLFAAPGVAPLAGGFAGSFSERGRSWFAGVNNGAFFCLFSLLWFDLGYEAYWRVPAVFGAVLIGLGLAGRSRESSGSMHVAQGLAAVTVALALKLDGYHLALSFGIEALLLAGAFLRFRRLPELAFSFVAMASAALLVVLIPTVPLWSAGVTVVLIAGAAFVVRMAHERVDATVWFRHLSRHCATAGVLIASGVALVGCCLRLAVEWQAVATESVALVVVLIASSLDRKQWFPELRPVGMVFAGVTILLLFFHGAGAVMLGLVAVLAAGLAVLWEREAKRNGDLENIAGLVKLQPALVAWLPALTVPLALAMISYQLELGLEWRAVMVPLLAFVCMRGLGSPRLRSSIALLLLSGLGHEASLEKSAFPTHLLLPISAVVTLLVARDRELRSKVAEMVLVLATRVTACIGWIGAWMIVMPDHWFEPLALTAAVIFAWMGRRKWQVLLPEAWVMIATPLLGLLVLIAEEPWRESTQAAGPRGWLTIAVLIFVSVILPRKEVRLAQFRTVMLWVSVGMLSIWSTQLLVWQSGWSATGILWTLLGFGMVSAGLWQRIAVWRHAGFLLLGFALVKLFAVDVWDFVAFMRVVAFLSLGLALVVLGFFYNRFADLLKKLFEGD